MSFLTSVRTVKQRTSVRVIVGSVVGLMPVLLLLGLLWQTRDQLTALSWTLDWSSLFISFVLYSLALFIAVWIWGRLMTELGAMTGWSIHFKAYCQTNAARRIPLLPWHMIGRAYIYETQGISKFTTSLASILELLLITIAGLLISIVSLPLIINVSLESLMLMTGVLLICFWLVRPAPIRWIMRRLGQAHDQVHLKLYPLLVNITGYAMIWLLGGLILFHTANFVMTIGGDQIVWFVVAWTASGVAATLVSITPLGLGLREVTLAYMLSMVMPMPAAILLSVISRLILTIYEVAWSWFATVGWLDRIIKANTT